MNKSVKLSYLLIILCLFLSLQGCLIVPFIDSASQLGATKGDREALLDKATEKFKTDLYWGNVRSMQKVASDKMKSVVKEFYNTKTKDHKVVEAKVLSSEPDEEVMKAEVLLLWKSYKLDNLIIKEEKINQVWEFSFSDGWRLVEQEW